MTELDQIKKFYEQAFQSFKSNARFSEIDVNFYPYVGINHTIRVRSGNVFVRISDVFESAPSNVQKALAFILVARLLRKRIPPEVSEVYQSFIRNGEIQAKAIENKRRRGRKLIYGSAGEIYDLDEIFFRLNKMYFQNSLKKPTLTWSRAKTFRILGHHDSTHETIVISKSLDDKKVPPFVVEFVVFHEMLHIFHPTVHRNNRRYNHTLEFRRDEKKFAHFEEAELWIQSSLKKLKRRAKVE